MHERKANSEINIRTQRMQRLGFIAKVSNKTDTMNLKIKVYTPNQISDYIDKNPQWLITSFGSIQVLD